MSNTDTSTTEDYSLAKNTQVNKKCTEKYSLSSHDDLNLESIPTSSHHFLGRKVTDLGLDNSAFVKSEDTGYEENGTKTSGAIQIDEHIKVYNTSRTDNESESNTNPNYLLGNKQNTGLDKCLETQNDVSSRNNIKENATHDLTDEAATVQNHLKDISIETSIGTSRSIGAFFKAVLFIGNCFVVSLPFGYLMGLGVLFVSILDEFKSTRAEALPIISVYAGTMVGFGGVIAPLANRFNIGHICSLAGVMACVGCIICYFAQSIIVLVLGVGVFTGIGLSAGFLVPYVIVGEAFESSRDTMIAAVSIFTGIGTVYFPYSASFLLEHYGWRGAFLLYGGYFLHAVPVGMLNAIFKKRRHRSSSTNAPKMFNFSIFKKPALLVTMFIFFLISGLFPTVNAVLGDFLRERGFESKLASNLLSYFGFASVTGRTLGTVTSPFITCKRFLLWPIFIFICSVSTFMYVFFETYEHLLIINIAYGLGWGLSCVTYPVVVMQIAGGEMYTTALGYTNVFGGLGGLVGGPIAGLIKDTTGSYDLLCYTATGTGLVAISSAIILIISEKVKSKP